MQIRKKNIDRVLKISGKKIEALILEFLSKGAVDKLYIATKPASSTCQ